MLSNLKTCYAYKLIKTVNISSILREGFNKKCPLEFGSLFTIPSPYNRSTKSHQIVYHQVFLFSAALVGNLWCKLKGARILCFRIALIFNLPTTADNLVLLQTDTNKQEEETKHWISSQKHLFLQIRWIVIKTMNSRN